MESVLTISEFQELNFAFWAEIILNEGINI